MLGLTNLQPDHNDPKHGDYNFYLMFSLVMPYSDHTLFIEIMNTIE